MGRRNGLVLMWSAAHLAVPSGLGPVGIGRSISVCLLGCRSDRASGEAGGVGPYQRPYWPLLKSNRTTSVCFRSSIPLARSWTVEISCDSHDRCLRKPCWVSVRMPLSSRCLIMLLLITCSINLQLIHARDKWLDVLEELPNTSLVDGDWCHFGVCADT